jgi:hypothetical protein
MQVHLANLCVNGTSSASFAPTLCALTKLCEKTQNISFGSNGLDRVRSLQKVPTQLRFANLCVHGTSLARFAPTFAVTKRCEKTQNMSCGSNGLDRVCSLQKILMQPRLANLCVNGTSSARFALTFVQ